MKIKKVEFKKLRTFEIDAIKVEHINKPKPTITVIKFKKIKK